MITTEYVLVDRVDLLTDQVFLVSINNILISFSKVSNIQGSVEYESFVEGGNNEYPLLFRKQKQQADTLILEKGIVKSDPDLDTSSIWEGQRIFMLTIMVVEDFVVRKTFYFDEGMIVKKTFSDLNAMGNNIFVVKLEIAHTGLLELN